MTESWPVVHRVPDRPLVTAVLSGIFALLLVVGVVVRSHGDVSRLVHAAPPWTDPAKTPASLDVQRTEDGFDGQFFYRLAVAPLDDRRVAGGVRFDLPALRSSRWLYGALAWVASGGDRDGAPAALVALNVLAAAAVGGLSGSLARSAGRHAMSGLLLALYPGFAYSLSLDTSELVAAAFLLAALLALRRQHWVLAALAFTLAVLTRDTTAVVPAGVAVAAAWSWWTHRNPAAGAERAASTSRMTGSAAAVVASAVPLAVFGVWQLVQRARFGVLPLRSSGANNLSAPLTGVAHELRQSFPPSGGAEAFRLLSIAVLAMVVGAAALTMRESRAPLAEKVTWVPAVVVVCLLNAYLWSGATAFMRAGTEAYLISGLILLGSRRRWTDLATVPVVGLWVLTAAAQVGKAGPTR